MNDDLKPTRVSDCDVCYGHHSDDIHDATLRVRRWLRHEVTRKLTEGAAPVMAEELPVLVS